MKNIVLCPTFPKTDNHRVYNAIRGVRGRPNAHILFNIIYRIEGFGIFNYD